MSQENYDKNVIKSSGIIGLATFASRILGFARDVIIASLFGANLVADSFFIAFRIPNILRKLMSEGTLSAGLVPEFTKLITDKKEDEVNKTASLLINIVSLGLIAVTVICIVEAKALLWVIAPGFDKEKAGLTIKLIHWIFPYLPFIGITAVFIGLLHAHKHFLIPAITPIILNISIIICALSLNEKFSVMSLAIGVVIGGAAQMFLQIFMGLKKGFRYSFCFNYQNSSAVKKILSSFFGVVWGLSVTEVNILVSMQLASFLKNGSISFLYYSSRIVQFPLGIFGVALGTAILPTLCSQAAQDNTKELTQTLQMGVQLLTFLVIPSMVGLIILREPIVRVLFYRGAFSAANVISTSNALLGYASGLCFLALLKVVVPVFYSLNDYKTPVRTATFAVGVNLLVGILLLPMKHTGLAFASSISGAFNLIILMLALKKKLGNIGGRTMLIESLKSFAASFLMGMVIVCGKGYGAGALFSKIGIGIVVYMLSAWLFRCKAIHLVAGQVVQHFKAG